MPVVHPQRAGRRGPHARLPHRERRQASCTCCAASSTATPSTPLTATGTACWRTPGATPSTPAALDWIGDGDHDNGFGHEYMWWHIQKMTDLLHNPPDFVGVHDLRAQRRLSRTAIATSSCRNRGIRPVAARRSSRARPRRARPDTKVLYAYLKHFGGICAVAHQRHQHGHRLARQRPGGRAGRRDLPGPPPQLRALRRPALADGQDADRRLSSRPASSGTPWRRAIGSASRAPATTSART